MKPLYTETEFLSAKSDDKLLLECSYCKISFLKKKKDIKRSGKGLSNTSEFCSLQCNGKARTLLKTIVNCRQCNKEVIKNSCELQSLRNSFCNRSCSAIYRNTHKTKGYRVSKLELFLQKKLIERYPTLVFDFNQTDAINSELDIYILSLRLAFELNGIFHYEPIYGSGKLCQIQNNDNRKFQACLEHNIELCIIDSSSLKNFTEKRALVYLNIITNIIDLKLNGKG